MCPCSEQVRGTPAESFDAQKRVEIASLDLNKSTHEITLMAMLSLTILPPPGKEAWWLQYIGRANFSQGQGQHDHNT